MTQAEQGLGVPVACGALGEFDPAAVARLMAALGDEMREVHRDERSVLCLDREPTRWRDTEGESLGLAWPERLPDRSAAATTWREAAAAGACGLHISGESRGIHGSSSGIAPLYWLRTRGAVYFATRLDPLARAGLVSLTVDWQAWAELLTLAHPLPGRTPFAEIGRVERGARVGLARNGALDRQPGSLDWANGEPLTRDEAAERVVAALRAEVEAIEPYGPVLSPLTGGWDSRLIVCGLAERGLVKETCTVDSDYGDDLEERGAAQVAAHLGVAHRVITPELSPFDVELAHAAEVTEYQSLPHLAMHRLVAGLPRAALLSDGMGGQLLKGRYLRPEIMAHPIPAEGAFDSLVPELLPVLYAKPAWEALRARVRSAFLRAAEPYRGHPMEPQLATHARAIRAVGSSPMSIVGRHNPVFMPLVADSIAGAAIRAPVEDRRDGTMYRHVLALISPGIEAIPSTNEVERIRQWRPLFRKREARDAHRALLARSPLRPWFTPRLLRWIERDRMARIDEFPRRVQRLHGICTFGLWCERYRDLVGEPDPSAMFE